MANRWQLYRKPQKPEILGTEFLAFVTDFGMAMMNGLDVSQKVTFLIFDIEKRRFLLAHNNRFITVNHRHDGS